MTGLLKMKVCVLALLAASAAVAAFAEETPPPGGTTTTQGNTQESTTTPRSDEPDPNEVICKREPAETGTRLGKRKVCLTRREWDQQARDAQKATEDLQRKGAQNGMKGS